MINLNIWIIWLAKKIQMMNIINNWNSMEQAFNNFNSGKYKEAFK